MSARRRGGARYWDTSAILSLFVADAHSGRARAYAAERGPHLCSSLAHAEACSVLWRLARSGALRPAAAERALAALAGRVLTPCEGAPSRGSVELLARRHDIRGADLWHLAFALEALADEHSLRLVTFDERLARAATAEDLPLAP